MVIRKWYISKMYNVVVTDSNDNVLSDVELRDKVIENEQYYKNINLISKRIQEENGFD